MLSNTVSVLWRNRPLSFKSHFLSSKPRQTLTSYGLALFSTTRQLLSRNGDYLAAERKAAELLTCLRADETNHNLSPRKRNVLASKLQTTSVEMQRICHPTAELNALKAKYDKLSNILEANEKNPDFSDEQWDAVVREFKASSAKPERLSPSAQDNGVYAFTSRVESVPDTETKKLKSRRSELQETLINSPKDLGITADEHSRLRYELATVENEIEKRKGWLRKGFDSVAWGPTIAINMIIHALFG
ncbi:hypothetical protein MMC13_006639 [Lambiella insularis]|nr:hypothetical protein [Lambiella insularis]